MLNISEFSEKSITQILNTLEMEEELSTSLPGGGLIHIEKNLPYIIVYRKRKKDDATLNIILDEASYLLIGDEDFEYYQKLLQALAHKLSSRYKTYLIFEIYSGESKNDFTIKAPTEKLTSTVHLLKEELVKMNDKFKDLNVEPEIIDTKQRQKKGNPEIMTVDDAKTSGAVLLSLEIPTLFNSKDNTDYPVFIRKIKDQLITCIHKTIYDYARVHTNCRMETHLSLGRKHLKDKVFEIDRALSEIERSYQFLWLVSPANIHEIKHTFFESNYNNVLNYHYRLLPIDPDLLKRRLFNLQIEDIHDPAMSFIFREKREELDQQISMLAERGTPNFFYNSIRLYKGISPELNQAAKAILEDIDETEKNEKEDSLDAKKFSSLARREFDYFIAQDKKFNSKIHIRKDVNIIMVNNGELYIPADYRVNKIEAKALVQHEVGTHILTHYNGSLQSLELLSSGLADYDPLQEGLAVMSEYLVGGLTANRLRTLAGRVIAGSARIEGADFHQIFRLLKMTYDFSAERAFNITSRIMQGGGFLKDIIYLKGLVQLCNHLQNGGEYKPLLAGKFGLQHSKIITELTERGILQKPTLLPSYLMSEDVTKKLNLIRNGLPISKMINT